MNFNRKTGLVAIAAVLLVGAGTATVVDYFTATEGTMDVDQSITGTLDTITYENPTAPYTDYNEFSVTNNNEERAVSFNWEVIDEGNFGDAPAFRELYAVQEFDLYNIYKANNQWNMGEVSDHSVEVVPNVDQVTYRVPTQENTTYVNLEVTQESGDNYHVQYNASTEGFEVSNPSLSGNFVDASTVSEVVDTSTTSTGIEVTLNKAVDYNQTFAVAVGEEDFNNSIMTENFISSTGGSYSNSGDQAHESVDYTDHLGTQEEFSASEVRDYNLGVFFDTDTQDKEYTVNVGASPVTVR